MLWPACVRVHDFAAQLAAAREAGFSHLAVSGATLRRLAAAGWSPAALRRLAADEGMALGPWDGFSAWAPERCDPALPAEAQEIFAASAEECLEWCAALGLHAVGATAPFPPGRHPREALVEGFAAFCEQARPLGVRVDLEFIPFWAVPDLTAAVEIVSASGAANAGVLLDSWHFFRGGGDPGELAALPAGRVTAVQLADAPPAPPVDLWWECLHGRLPPGEGGLPLDRLRPALAGALDLGVEVFSDALDALPAAEAARRAARGLELFAHERHRR
ncbi:MAG: xylose isomerase [Porticoccaceae bacterium]|nr:MAG: xylose isomerase [Porticoccaceae bacterium]